MIYACSVYGQKQEGLRSLLSQFKKIPPFSIQENPSFLNSRKPLLSQFKKTKESNT